MALGSSLPPGNIFRPHPARENAAVLGAQVPNGSRTKPVPVATKPELGSTWPLVTALVVEGSKTVPSGIERRTWFGVLHAETQSRSCVVPDWPVIKSCRFVYPLLRSATVGTEPVWIVPCRRLSPS